MSGPKRVALFIPHLGIGGAELQLGLLAPRLAAAGWDPVVATVEDLHGTARRLADEGVEVVFLPRAGRFGLDTMAALSRLVRSRRVEVVHAWLWASNWRAAVVRGLTPHVRVVTSIRSMEDDLGTAHLLAYRALSPWIDAILVNSNAVLDRSASRTGIAREKYRVVRNAVDLHRFDSDSRVRIPLPWDPASGPVIGFVGTLHARKRAARFAPLAAGILARVPAARFVVVGDGPERAQLESECVQLGLADRFLLAGYQERVAPFLRRMDLLLHPSMNEGSSNAILEGMAAGLPVVAYAVSGNLEMVVEGTTGRLVPDGREDELVAAAADLLESPGAARRLGVAGRLRIERDYSVEAMMRSTIDVYESVLARR